MPRTIRRAAPRRSRGNGGEIEVQSRGGEPAARLSSIQEYRPLRPPETVEDRDACALYDTNADGKVDRAVCVTIVSPNVLQSGNPKCYTCNNTKAQKCAGSVPVSAPAYASTLSGLGWMRPISRMLLTFL